MGFIFFSFFSHGMNEKNAPQKWTRLFFFFLIWQRNAAEELHPVNADGPQAKNLFSAG